MPPLLRTSAGWMTTTCSTDGWMLPVSTCGMGSPSPWRTHMNEMHIDIETFSAIDLGKAGAYKYAEDPSFEILLFGVSIDGGPVRV